MQPFFHSNKAKRIAVGVIMLAVGGAIYLAGLVYAHPVLFSDIAISQEVQEDGGPGLLPFMRFVSLFGTPWIALIITLAAAGSFYALSCPREARYVLFAPVAAGVNVFIKLAVNRPRPTDALVMVYQNFSDASFPSGHVVYYVVFFGFLATTMIVMRGFPLLARLLVSLVSLALILLVSVSRVYLGVHWATDVIGGYCVGFIFLATLLYFYFRNLPAEPHMLAREQ